MIRTQIYIPDDLYRELTFVARSSKTNLSNLIRASARAVVKKYVASRKRGARSWGKGFIGAGHGGPKNLSRQIDRFLYGDLSTWAK